MITVEIQCKNASHVATALYFSDEEFMTGAGDPTLAAQVFTPRLMNPFEFMETLDGVGDELGASLPNFGGFSVHSQFGDLVHLLNYDFYNAPLIIKRGDPGTRLTPTLYSNLTTVFTGNIDAQPTASVEKFMFAIAGPDKKFRETLILNYYAGDVQPEGSAPFTDIEGDEDIKDKPKVRCFGAKNAILPVLVNKNGLIWQVNDGKCRAIPMVYDNSNALTKATGLGITDGDMDDGDFDAWTGSPGEFVTNVIRGLFRLGGRAFGEVTADVEGHVDATMGYIETHADLIEFLAREAGHTAFDTTSFSDHETADGATIGVYISDEPEYYDALVWAADSCGSYWGIKANGDFYIRKFSGPAATATQTIVDGQTSNWVRSRVIEPYWQIRLGYGGVEDDGTGSGGGGGGSGGGGGPGGGGGGIIKDEEPPYRPPVPVIKRKKSTRSAVTRGRIGADVGPADVIVKDEGADPVVGPSELVVSAEDTAVQTNYVGARESEVITTYYATETGAQTEVDRRLLVWKTPRGEWQVDAGRLSFTPTQGETYTLYDRYLFPAGKKMVVIGVRTYGSRDFYRLTVLF